MRKFVSFMDPKLEKFRPKKPPTPKYTPKTLEEFIQLVQRTPKSVVSKKDRERIAAVMSFGDHTVGDLMIPRKNIVFVKEDEILGPLVLDNLYKSGFKNFPVVDGRGRVVGMIHTEALNALEIRKTDRADKYMDKKVNYLKVQDSLKEAVDEIERTNSYYFLVQDENETTVGCFTIQTLLDYLIGKE